MVKRGECEKYEVRSEGYEVEMVNHDVPWF